MRSFILPRITLLVIVYSSISMAGLPAPDDGAQRPTSTDPTVAAVPHGLLRGYGFIENSGQFVDHVGNPSEDVLYMYTGANCAVQLKRSAFRYELFAFLPLHPGISEATGRRASALPEGAPDPVRRISEVIEVELVGANPDPRIVALDMAPDYINYYTTASTADRILHVRHFRTVIYEDIYPGIDIRFQLTGEPSGNERPGSRIKYDIIVHPGGRLQDVRFRYIGAEALIQATPTRVRIAGRLGVAEESIPKAYSMTNGKAIGANMVVEGNEVRYEMSGYSPAEINVIDPLVNYSTYYGGSGEEEAKSVTVDNNGNMLIAGWTHSTASIAAANSNNYVYQGTGGGVYCDAFIAKFNSAGQRQWATYFGASGYTEDFREIEACSSGDFAVVGYTDNPSGAASSTSVHQPTNGGTFDVLLMRWLSDGSLHWSTYYGGTAWDLGYGIAHDSNGDILIAGETQSANNISSGSTYQTSAQGNRDGFVAKFWASSGTLAWATYYGGSGDETIQEIAALSGTSDFVIAGTTDSDSPANEISSSGACQSSRGGLTDAMVARITGSGARVWGTYYGGSGNEEALDVCCSSTGTVFISGKTYSANFPVLSPFQATYGGNGDAYCLQLTGSGTAQWATFLGGSGDDIGYGVALNAQGDILLGGETYSTNFPLLNAINATFGTFTQMFVTKFDASHSLRWSTYYGGSASADNALDIAVDASSNVILTGYTYSNNFPVCSPHQSTFGGARDAVLAILRDPILEISVSGTQFYPGDAFQVTASVTAGPFNSGNVFYAELSDETGDFSSPVIIGQATGTGTTALSVQIPSLIRRGTSYRMRIRASDPVTHGNDNGTNLTVHGGYEWTGAVDGTWGTAGNWNPPVVPTHYDDITIPTTTTPLSYIPCPITLHDVTLNAAAGTTITGGYLTIAHRLTLTQGILLTRGALSVGVLEISPAASIVGGGPNSYVIAGGTTGGLPSGYILHTIGASPVTIPLGNSKGYAPLTVQNAGTSDRYTFQLLDGVRRYGSSSGPLQSTDVVSHMWFVDEYVAGGSDLTLTFQWDAAHEATGFDRTDAYVAYSDCMVWAQRSFRGAAVGSGPFTFTLSNVTALPDALNYPPTGGAFAIADPGTALWNTGPYAGGEGSGYAMDFSAPGPVPVELVSFSVREKDGIAFLTWRTATELNNFGFDIERSYAGPEHGWHRVGFVPGAGTSQVPRRYQFEDRPDPATRTWYRLRQMDRDGTSAYSPVVCLERASLPSNPEILVVYPHPARGNAVLELLLPEATTVGIQVCSLLGETLHTVRTDVSAESGRHVFPLSVEALPTGTYLLRVLTPDVTLLHTLQVIR